MMDSRYESLRKEISYLRETGAGTGGRSTGHQEFWGYIVSVAALLLSLLSVSVILAKWL